MHAGECSPGRVRQLEMLVGVLLLRRSTRHGLAGAAVDLMGRHELHYTRCGIGAKP
jgi:hypothetical protein